MLDVDGFNSSDVFVWIGERECAGVRLEDDGTDATTGSKLTRILCTMPAGVGSDLAVVVETPGGRSRSDTSGGGLVVN